LPTSNVRDIHTVNLPYAVALGGTYDRDEASPIDLQGQVIGCNGRQLAAAAAAAYAIPAEGRARSIMYFLQLGSADSVCVCVCLNLKHQMAQRKDNAPRCLTRGGGLVASVGAKHMTFSMETPWDFM